MLNEKKNYGFDTLQAHAGQAPDPTTGASAVPIYQTASFAFESVQYAAELFNHERSGNIYSRIMNPTVDVLEKRLAALERGTGAVAFASGMAAEAAAVFTLAGAGDEIVAATTLYGGTYTLFGDRLPGRFGINVKFVDVEDFEALDRAIGEKTKLVYFETLGNPQINLPDIEKICQIAHSHGVPTVCDNTFGTPLLIDLKKWGVDIVIHSVTKYLGGHGTTIAGALIDLGNFDWKGNARFPDFNEPDPTNHGIVYADLAAPVATKARAQVLRDMGACLAPFSAFLVLQGLETLSMRVERHCRNAETVAEFLSAHPNVSYINYPYLPGDKYHERYRKYMPQGCGAIMTFGVKGGKAAGARFIERCEIFTHLANIADAKSLVIHPASTTHSQLDEKALIASGTLPDMIRMSVGLEDVNDLIDDLRQALEG
ncbi:MAG: O-acetylhomoserine aminocarboxypropyltransferase/cysteine synthase [Eubacteriales bacterium]|nr:O-acetylhomoserine aminocarboxypropyltransferase/cysteine synthase [Eubacteriales bacterium]